MKKRNKKYRPPTARTIPITIRYDRTADRVLKMIPATILDAFARQEGSTEAWYEITFSLNVGLRLAEHHFTTPEASEMLCEALEASCAISDRFKRVGKWGAKPEELNWIRDGLLVYDNLREATTRREQITACDYVEALVNQTRKAKPA